jgi:hypothetical protein
VKFSSWTPKERAVSGAFFLIAFAGLFYGLASNIALFSSEFFSMLAVFALFIGFACTPSFMLQPLKASLGEGMETSLKIGFGFFCVLQLIAVALRVFAPAAA